MPKKLVTEKTQIPKWYKRRIKQFEKLSEEEALFEYEALKLQERARKYAKKAGIEYKKLEIVRPKTVIESDIKYVREVSLERVKQAVKEKERIIKPEAPIYDYERVEWKEQKFPEYRYEDIDWYDDYMDDYELPDKPRKEKQYESPEQYLQETEQRINPSTGEVLPIPEEPQHGGGGNILDEDEWRELVQAEEEQAAREFLEDLKEYIQEEGNKTIVAHSYRPSGKTKAAKERKWLQDNVDSAVNTLIAKIDAILNDETMFQNFVRSHASQSTAWEAMVLAASEYINSSYKSKGGDPVQAAELNRLLNAGPISLSEAMNFVDSAYDEDDDM